MFRVLLSTIYFDMVYMVRLFYLLNKVKKQDNISVFKYLFLPLQTMLVSIIYCIASWKFFLNANTEYSELSFFNNTWWDIAWSVLPFIGKHVKASILNLLFVVIKSSTSSDIKKLAAYTKASSQSKVSTNDNYKTTSTEKI
ncbi:hypothetical protein HDU92_003649 [Lobulomyces angularis]|nr:hypothetical protein HDU92_003649 [Lobulomyces angularis]